MGSFSGKPATRLQEPITVSLLGCCAGVPSSETLLSGFPVHIMWFTLAQSGGELCGCTLGTAPVPNLVVIQTRLN